MTIATGTQRTFRASRVQRSGLATRCHALPLGCIAVVQTMHDDRSSFG